MYNNIKLPEAIRRLKSDLHNLRMEEARSGHSTRAGDLTRMQDIQNVYLPLLEQIQSYLDDGDEFREFSWDTIRDICTYLEVEGIMWS